MTKRKLIYSTPAILLLLLTIMGVVILVQKKTQDLRSRATLSGPKLSLAPAAKSAEAGETFFLASTLDTDTDTVSAAQLHVSYDPTAVQILAFTPGAILPVVLVPETHGNGTISVTLGAQPSNPYKGIGILGTWTIKILAAKQSSISYNNATTQVAAIGKPTNALVSTSGSTMTGPTPPSTRTPTPTPTSTPSPTPIHTPTPTPSQGTPTATPALTPTSTPKPSPTPTPTPRPSFRPSRFLPPTSTPTPVPPKTTPSTGFGQIATTTRYPVISVTPSPTASSVPPVSQVSPPTFIDRLINSIVSFFKNLFGK